MQEVVNATQVCPDEIYQRVETKSLSNAPQGLCTGLVQRSQPAWLDPSQYYKDSERVAALRMTSDLKNTLPEERFDRVTKLLALLYTCPVSLITLCDDSLLFCKSTFGPLSDCFFQRKGSLCDLVNVPAHPEVVVIEDATEDKRVANLCFVTGVPHIRFYAAVPLIGVAGHRYGTLCIMDFCRRSFSAEKYNLLLNFGEIVVREMERGRQDQLEQLLKLHREPLREAAAYSEGVALIDITREGWPITYANDIWTKLEGGTTASTVGCNLLQSRIFQQISKEVIVQLKTSVGNNEPAVIQASHARLTFKPSSSQVLQENIHTGIPSVCGNEDSSRFAFWFVQVEIVSRQSSTNSDFNGLCTCPLTFVESKLSVYDEYACRPKLFANVELGPLLGVGSFGKVYRAQKDGNLYSVKIQEVLQDDMHMDALHEAELSVQLKHPNLVQTFMYDVLDSSGGQCQAWMMQEYCEGGRLIDAIDRGQFVKNPQDPTDLKEFEVKEICLDIARGMHYLHDRDIVHADLTSANVLFRRDPSSQRGYIAVVSDFGRSCKANEACSGIEAYGTISHSSPELFCSESPTKACDVYSYGVILYELAAQTRAWNGYNPAHIMYAVGSGSEELGMPHHAPQFLRALGDHCMQWDPMMRPSFAKIVDFLTCRDN